MAKRTLIQGGLALPGLAKDPGKLLDFRQRRSRKSAAESSSSSQTSRSCTTSTKRLKPIDINYSDDSTSLIDDSGEFVAPKLGVSLEHLTKSRPRSPGRRASGQRNGARSRSRSPSTRKSDGSFDYGMGLMELDYSVEDYRQKDPSHDKLTGSETPGSPAISPRSSSRNDYLARDVDLSRLPDVLTTSSRLSNQIQVIQEPKSLAVAEVNGFQRANMDINLKTASPGRNQSKSVLDLKSDSGIRDEEHSSCSDDIGDMLIGDYVDSDLDSEPEKPPLPSSPPPLEGELDIVNNEKDSRTFDHELEGNEIDISSSHELNSAEQDSSKQSKQTQSLSTNKYFPPLGGFDRQISLPNRTVSSYGGNEDRRDLNQFFPKPVSRSVDVPDIQVRTEVKPELSTYGGKLSTTLGARGSKPGDSTSSSRRRRFKPVSLDTETDNTTESNKLLQTLPNSESGNKAEISDSLNKTFPRTYSGNGNLSSSGEKRKETNWGIGVGTLNSSFTESSLTSGTIFDRYLMKKGERQINQQEEKAQKQYIETAQPYQQQMRTSGTYNKSQDKSSDFNSFEKSITHERQPLPREEDSSYTNNEETMLEDGIGIDDTENCNQDNDGMVDDDTDSVNSESTGLYVPSFDNNSMVRKNDDVDGDGLFINRQQTKRSNVDSKDDELLSEDNDMDDVDCIDSLDLPASPPIPVQAPLMDNKFDTQLESGRSVGIDYSSLSNMNDKRMEHNQCNLDGYKHSKSSNDFMRHLIPSPLYEHDGDDDADDVVVRDFHHHGDDDDIITRDFHHPEGHDDDVIDDTDGVTVRDFLHPEDDDDVVARDSINDDGDTDDVTVRDFHNPEDDDVDAVAVRDFSDNDDDDDTDDVVVRDFRHPDDDVYDEERLDDVDASDFSDEGSNLGDYVERTLVQDDVDEGEVYSPPVGFSAEADEDVHITDGHSLYQPPPMFASDDDESDDEVDFVDVPPPLMIDPELSMSKPKKIMPFHKIPLGDWTEEDTREWLDYVGLGHFKEQFKVHRVNGRTLKNINFQLLEEIGINSPDEREIVLSEIYELDNPSEDEQLESEIQDALESATEQDKEKILAVLTALRSPVLSSGIDLATPSTGSSSPRDSDPGYHLSSDTNSLASSVTASDDLSHRGSAEVTPSTSLMHLHFPHQQHGEDLAPPGNLKAKSTKGQDAKKDDKKSKDKKKRKNKKDKKRISKFWESLSISHTSSKLNKLFGSKKLNPTMQYLLQAGPQGIIRVWPVALTGQTKYCSFMVSMTTTSSQVIGMVIEKFEVVADPLRYYLCEVGSGKKGANRALEDTDCPLLLQCRWPDPEKYHFEMRCRDEGVVRMLFELEGFEDDLDYRSIGVSSRTPCKDVLPLIVRKYDLPGSADDFNLMEVSEENEDVRQVVAGHVCPLKLQKAWNDSDHVFRLVRVRPLAAPQPRPQTSSSKPDAPPAPRQYAPAVPSSGATLPPLDAKFPAAGGTSSEASSLRGGYESDSTDQQDRTSEENLTFQDLPETTEELDIAVLQVQDQMAAPETLPGRSRGQSTTNEAQFAELQEIKTQLLNKEQEIASLKEQHADLLEKEKELEIWQMRNKELVEREEEVEQFKIEQENILKQLQEVREKEGNELEIRDREIERLYARNRELNERDKEFEEMQRKMADYTRMEETLEHLQRVNNELSKERSDLQRHYQRLEEDMRELQSQENKGRGKETELNAVRDQLAVSESKHAEVTIKLEEVTRRNALLERSAEVLESLRRENEVLVGKTREADEMRKNIIKLTSQLREVDKLRLNQGELDDLKLNLNIIQAEKQQLQSRVEELDRVNNELRDGAEETERLRAENASLRRQSEELTDIRRTVKTLKAELNEAEALRQRFTRVQDLEKSLRSDVQAKSGEVKQKNRRIEELERKLAKTTDTLTRMKKEAVAQEQQRENLNRLLVVIKDKDPALLQALHRSLTDSSKQPENEEEEEEEEWC